MSDQFLPLDSANPPAFLSTIITKKKWPKQLGNNVLILKFRRAGITRGMLIAQ